MKVLMPQLGETVAEGTVDSLAIRPVGIVTQSFNHRAVDGAYSAAYLARVRELLE